MRKVKDLLVPPMHFLAHIIAGTGLFIVIGLAAYTLQKFVDLLESNGTDPIIIFVMRGLEYLTFSVDGLTYVVMLLGSATVFCREFVREVRKS